MVYYRRFFSVIVASLLASLCAGGAARIAFAQEPAVAPVAVLTEINKGETLVVNPNDVVTVHLKDDPSGAGWSVANISSDGAKLLGGFQDAGGISTASFQATTLGTVAITLTIPQPNAAAQTPLATFAFTFDVQNGAAGSAPNSAPAVRPGAIFKPASFVTKDATSGVVTYPDGSSYDGALAQGLPAGQGTFTYSSTAADSNVVSASGDWSDGSLSDGDLLLRSGVRYHGGLDADGKVDGPAHFDLPDGAVLATVFAHGNYSGDTTWLMPPDPRYKTESPNKLVVTVNPPSPSLTGPATETFGNGSKLVGTMQDGRFEGPATFPAARFGSGYGPALSGTFVHGILQGPFHWNEDGNRISGTMLDGSPESTAVLTTPAGKRCNGRIVQFGGTMQFNAFTGQLDGEGRPNSFGTTGCESQEQMTGHFSHGQMIGHIRDRLADGTTYDVNVGNRPSDSLTGAARVTFKNGDVARGFLKSNRWGAGTLNGPGTYSFAKDEYTLTGTWHDGTFSSTSTS